MISYLAELMSTPEQACDILANCWEAKVAVLPILKLADMARRCRLRKAFKNIDGAQHGELQIRVDSVGLQHAVTDALLTEEGVMQKMGAPPKSGLARDVEKILAVDKNR